MAENKSSNVLENLETIMPLLTNAQQKAAYYIINNIMEVIFMPIEKLAFLIGVSTSTIVRLALKLGYSGYSEFIQDIQELAKKQILPNARLEENAELYKSDDLLYKNLELHISNIKSTFEKQARSTLDECVTLVASGKKLYFSGTRASFSMAYYLYYQFYRLTGNCVFLDTESIVLPEQVSAVGEDDVVIMLAFPRYPPKVIQIAKLVKQNGAKTIGITDSSQSPLAMYCDYILPCAVKSLGFHSSISGVIFIVDYLISMAALLNKDAVEKRFSDTEPFLSELINYK
jgi:DNA-binding MurR/RpiR family transcriptional regulator